MGKFFNYHHTIRLSFLMIFTTILFKGYACDQSSVTILTAVENGGVYTYTAEVCLGISPNWGSTDAFTLNADQNITGTSTTLTSTYNYCSVDIAFNGAGCAVSSMGQPPAGGTIQTANVTANSSIGGGDLTFAAGNAPGWLAPDDLRGDCADCNNGDQLCWTIEFTTAAPITTISLEDAEGDAVTCPDELDATIPTPVVCVPADLTAEVNGGTAAITVCEGDAVDLSSACNTCVTMGSGQTSYSWSGPDSYSSSNDDPGSFNATATSGGTYTLSGITGTCPTQSTAVTVNVNALPTGTLGTPALDDCASVTVPVSFTGDGNWTFTYQIDGVDQPPITATTNPYDLTVATTGTVTLNGTAGVTNTTCAGAGAVSGSSVISISAVDSDAGSDIAPDPDTDITINATGTAGNDGYDTIAVASNQSNTTNGNIADGATFDAGTITLSGLSNNCPLDNNNMTANAVCFWYTNLRAGNQLSATLCTDNSGTNCITVPVGGIPNSDRSMGQPVTTEYCFDYGDILNLTFGQACNTTLYLDVTDVGGGDDGSFDQWTTSFQDLDLSLRPNPTYAWSVSSGAADLSYLSSTTTEDPVFNAPGGTAAGCYNLTVTDGAGCTSVDEVCFNAVILGLDLLEFDVSVVDRNVYLNWEMMDLRNNYRYYVQRSVDGNTFQDISGMVKPSEARRFDFVDKDPLNKAYYRIKEISDVGELDYSTTRFVSLRAENSLEIMHIYPQPLVGNSPLHVTVVSGKEQDASVVLYNLQGQKVLEEEFHLNQGITTLDLNPTSTHSGLYSLELITTDRKLFAKVNKQ